MSNSSESPPPSSAGEEHQEEDLDMKMLNAKRMLELRRRMNSTAAKKLQAEKTPATKSPPTDREILLKALVDRGDEVLYSAEASYPKEMRILEPKLADLVRQGKVATITGGDLLQFLRSIGMRVSISTSISVEEHGKFVSIAEKLKREME